MSGKACPAEAIDLVLSIDVFRLILQNNNDFVECTVLHRAGRIEGPGY